MAWTTARELQPGAAVFYGVRPAWAHLWWQAIEQRREWVYLDNSYFDAARERQFRATRGRIQHTGRGESDGKRFAALGVEVRPMRETGETVLICAQSDEFMETVAADPGWLSRVRAGFAAGKHEVVVRRKGERRPLAQDLARAGLCVTWSSASAVEALLAGVRVMCAPECCATYADDRRQWASVLADNQWTLEEMAQGHARTIIDS